MNNDELILDCIRLLAPLWARIARSDKALAHQGRRALQSAALQYAEGRYARGGNRDAKLHSAYAEAGLARARELLPSLIPFEHEVSGFGGHEPTEAHMMGGTPMGTSPENGVVDAHCRVFDVPNLACLGGSSFTTGAAANPTLTIAALSLYAGEQL